jgi:hypothetical protein
VTPSSLAPHAKRGEVGIGEADQVERMALAPEVVHLGRIAASL